MGDWKVGDRVRIPAVSGRLRQPKAGNEGKLGHITGTEAVNLGGEAFDVPVITLDDGIVLKGYECWWEPVKEQVN